jgi:hypothetical protein
MLTVTLLEKIYGPFGPQVFQTNLASLCKGLKVKARVVGATDRGWLQLELDGEDQKVAMGFLDREIGIAPVNIAKVKKFATFKGRIISADEKLQELRIDIGVYTPHICDAVIPLERLQAQLADGKRLTLQRLTALFCLLVHMPLYVKVTEDAESGNEQVKAELSNAQISKFNEWISLGLDRLIVLGATQTQLDNAIKVSGHSRDIIRTENLGLLEHAVVCKLGTDAVGLTPKLGPHLYAANLGCFIPRKIREVIGRTFLE